ncbi:efflux transporter outer membrane subunit [soil metagenome]
MLEARVLKIWPILQLSVLCCALSACALGPAYQAPAASEAGVPEGWHAQLPHAGKVMELAQWWTQFDDPVLTELTLAAQRGSPTIAQAEARVRQARAALDTSEAGRLPSLSLSASDTRSNGTGVAVAPGVGTTQTLASAGLNAAWDLDLFGGTRSSVQSASALAAASEAAWHDSRVSLAAAVADAYVMRRQCEALLAQNEIDLSSRVETHRLISNKVQFGFTAPADALRTEASVAEGTSLLLNQKGLCARLLNQLAALTGIAQVELLARLKPNNAIIPVPAAASVGTVPAAVLSQRPDVTSAERALAAANADIGVAIANRLPRIALAGSIGINRLRLDSGTTRFNTWSFGPSLSLPIFDGGSGRALEAASRARYDEALAAYRQRVQTAVQEVEDALVRVDIALQRERSAEIAESRYQKYFDAKQVQFRVGASSLLDLEDARRITVAGKQALAAVRLERAQSWIALYKAAGGGWQEASNAAAAGANSSPSAK